MALVLKTDKTFTDDFGNSHSDAYGVIDQANFNKNRDKGGNIIFEIYTNQQARIDKKQPIYQKSYPISAEDFDTWFAPDVISADDNQYKQAYLYLLQKTHNAGDDENPDMQLDWPDWESDE